ncbi:MAG: twin-arginine translocation signal domain-containing protein [Planctomycetes bacterium]|nr:twin-arginine translocation signal domain-containing protein [Planctomycetota bacterium]
MPLSRRDFLRAGGAAAGAAALTPFAGPRPRALDAAPPAKRTEHLIFVAFAGGVRSRETIGNPGNVPNLLKIADAGVVCPQMVAANVGHYGATLSIFTGNTEYMGIRENEKGEHPTIFEYLRKQKNVPARKVWLSAGGGAQQLNFACSTHKNYGEAYAANIISSDGVFNAEFKDILDQFGRPTMPGDEENAALAKLRDGIDAQLAARGGGAADGNDAETTRRIERFILDEISGGTTRITGPGAGDAKTVRVAANIMRVFKPSLLGISLIQADVAHGSYNSYVEVIRRNDEELGTLWRAVQADPELRDTTAIFVLPEFGRDKDLNQRNGLDHGDGSDDLRKVGMVCAAPEFKKGAVLKQDFTSIDVCATMCKLFGLTPDSAPKSKPIKELWA